MMDRWMTRARQALAATAAAGALAACDKPAPVEAGAEPAVQLSPGIHPQVQVGPRTGDSVTVQLLLQRVEVTSRVSSFQGELTFDPGQVSVGGATLPNGVVGAWNQPQPGRVRVAGAAVDGMDDGPVLTLRVAAPATVDASAFQFTVEEVTTA
ncbi:MAG TPA: hypothetical protein VK358_03885, partial [Longimicrobium sp.]|nr:hypothetical protein [Longimicrobium sp.]